MSDEAKADVLNENHMNGTFFTCHKATIAGLEGGCCKGLFDQTEEGVVVMVKRLEMPIQWVDPDTMEEVTK